MSDREFDYAIGSAALRQEIGFLAVSVEVNNATNQWLYLGGLNVWVPQYTLGARYSLLATSQAIFSYTAPPGQVQPPTIAGQVCVIVYRDIALPPAGGVGMLGGRAPYYDRYPTDSANSFFSPNIAPHVSVARWTYTVPAGRRAYVESIQANVQAESAGDLAVTGAVGFAQSVCQFGTSTALVVANIQDLCPARTWAGALVGVSIELQPGDIVKGTTVNTYTATKTTHLVAAKITEFDA